VTCEGGIAERTRICENGNPGDAGCLGPDEEEQDCNPDLCPFMSQWSEWADCSTTCGGGMTTRERNCTHGNMGDIGCTSSTSESRICEDETCPLWSGWSVWAPCSLSCNNGTTFRERNCLFGVPGDIGCEGDIVENDFCETQDCPIWSDWSTWSLCTNSCGGGITNRERECENGNVGSMGCTGASHEENTCETQLCPTWSLWTAWTACTRTCGGGEKHRSRNCANEYNTTTCAGPDEEMNLCFQQTCDIYDIPNQWYEQDYVDATELMTLRIVAGVLMLFVALELVVVFCGEVKSTADQTKYSMYTSKIQKLISILTPVTGLVGVLAVMQPTTVYTAYQAFIVLCGIGMVLGLLAIAMAMYGFMGMGDGAVSRENIAFFVIALTVITVLLQGAAVYVGWKYAFGDLKFID